MVGWEVPIFRNAFEVVCVFEEVLFSRVWQLAEQVRWNEYGVQQCIIPSQERRHPARPEPSSTYVSLTGGYVSNNG